MSNCRIVEIQRKSGTNKAIQKAVDFLWKSGGGIVKIGPGEFTLHDSIHLRTGVHITGTGNRTILKKCPSVCSGLSLDSGYGHFDVSVEKPHLFKKGVGIYISDDEGKGFYATVATVMWKKSDSLGISRMLNHDYARIRNASVCSVFPVISGYYVKDVTIENLIIDGNSEENGFIDGCRGGGVFLLQCHGLVLKNITVRNYNGDGISFQQCTRLTIEDCEIINNCGSGLHPGSGSTGIVVKNCRINNNKKDGVFYCLRVSHTLIESCIITKNCGDGISIGARDTDHVIRNNVICENLRYGIYFRKADESMGGHRNLVESNTISRNCLHSGCAEVFIEDINNDQWFRKNFIDGGEKLNYGIVSGSGCKRICVSPDNRFTSVKDKAVYKNGERMRFTKPPVKIFSGPGFISRWKIRHLIPD